MKKATALGLFLLAAGAAYAADPQQAYTDALAFYKTAHYAEAAASCHDGMAALPEGETPLRGRLLVLQGRILTSQGDFPNAEAPIEKALSLDPTDIAAHRALGDLYFHERHDAEARVAYLDAQRYMGKPDAGLTLMLVYCALGQKEIGEALRLETTLNAFDDKTPAAYFAQAAVARFKGDGEAAQHILQSADTLYGTQIFADYNQDYLFLFASPK